MKLRKRFYFGIMIALVMSLVAAIPVMAANMQTESEESEDSAVDSETEKSLADEAFAEDFPEEGVSKEDIQEDFSDENPGDDISETEFYSVVESISTADIEGESAEEEDFASEIDDDSDLEYGIATFAKTPEEPLDDGFHQDLDDGEWYYYTDGEIDTELNSVIKGTVNDVTDWWYVIGGKVQLDFTGLADYSNASGWWYIRNGKVDRTYAGLAKNRNGWFYLKNGKVDRSYTGFAVNENGSWYMENGKLTRSKNSVIKDTAGILGTAGEWYYVVGSKVQYDFTGLADYSNASGWWYIRNGKVDRTYAGLAKNRNGWFYLKNGKVDRSYTGFAVNENGSWYMENGKLTRSKNSVIKDTAGILGKTGEWYYVVGSKVQYDFTGLADYKNSSGWWYITDGKVDRTVNTVAKNKYDWWYVLNGKVQKSFTGLADYSNASGWWYITNGRVDRTVTTVAQNKNGWYYIENGKVQRSFSGTVTIDGQTWSVVNGKATLEVSEDSEYTLTDDDIIYAGKDTTQLAAPVFSGEVGSGTMTLTWDPVPGAEKYRVFRKKYGDSSWTKLADTTATSYTDNLWTDSTVYFYTVRCVSSDGTEYMSDYIKSFSGSAIAEFAQQFVGNPYVYGGISLTNGCDCSGFVMQVYAHFGVYMPHYSGTQITLGREVSYADAQPGDIIGRTGHTMIYIGNGQVVHAQDSANGIRINDLSNISYTNIRRIF